MREDGVQFGQKQQTQGRGGGEQDQYGDGEEGESGALWDQVGQHDDDGASDDHAVHGHADVLRVVQRRNLHVSANGTVNISCNYFRKLKF